MDNLNKLEAEIEALFFASGDSVPFKRLCEVTNTDEKTMKYVLKMMINKYELDETRGVHIIKLEDNYQMCTKRDFYEPIRLMTEKKRKASLSGAALETLSVVAYNQPVTRSSVEFIRGVNSDGSLNRLIEWGLVEEVGRLDAPGRPILFGTTEEFLRVFGISSLSDLPNVDAEYNFSSLNGELAGEQTVMDLSDKGEDFEIQTFDENSENSENSENLENSENTENTENAENAVKGENTAEDEIKEQSNN